MRGKRAGLVALVVCAVSLHSCLAAGDAHAQRVRTSDSAAVPCRRSDDAIHAC
jgi:hypothetical protein